MAIHEYEVFSLSELLRVNSEISHLGNQDPFRPKVLWYRGQSNCNWSVIPTMYRTHSDSSNNAILDARKLGNTSTLAVQEEIRKQHFIGKNYHHIQKDLNSNLEWFEIMQHHGVNTRIVDWSESMMHSLIFTLECFLDKDRYRPSDRIDCKPCLWILEPIPWNIKAIKLIINNTTIIHKCLETLPCSDSDKTAIETRMGVLSRYLTDYMKMKGTEHLEYLFNLTSIIHDFNKMDTAELIYRLKNGEFYYCLFYLIKFVYLDHGVYDWQDVMPLAIIESYHSERIRTQRGTFAIFPYYKENEYMKKMKSLNIYLNAMDNMDKGNMHIHKIIIGNADQVAYDLIGMGADDTWLYPEMPIAANTIEMRKVLTDS